RHLADRSGWILVLPARGARAAGLGHSDVAQQAVGNLAVLAGLDRDADLGSVGSRLRPMGAAAARAGAGRAGRHRPVFHPRRAPLRPRAVNDEVAAMIRLRALFIAVGLALAAPVLAYAQPQDSRQASAGERTVRPGGPLPAAADPAPEDWTA